MGWAIRRPDGTYRAWNANAQDDTLQPGEVWEALAVPPVMQPRPPNPMIDKITLALLSTAIPPELKAILAIWKTQL